MTRLQIFPNFWNKVSAVFKFNYPMFLSTLGTNYSYEIYMFTAFLEKL